MSLKAAIYDPYLDTLGGGERYCLTVAEILLKENYQVDIFWSGNQEIVPIAEKRFDLQLQGINFVPDIFGLVPQKIDLLEESNLNAIHSYSRRKNNLFQKIGNIYQKYKVLSAYDVIFYLSDGSIPLLFSQKNVLHVQVPFIHHENLLNHVINFVKSKLIYRVVCNSNFTSSFLENFSKTKIEVLYPPVDIEKFSSSSEKENIILSVGRFDNILNAKKQDILITAFQKICRNHPDTKWKLVLAGGSHDSPEMNNYLLHLRQMANNLPIDFKVNPDFSELKEIYSTSKIYWHAAGYGVDEYLHPEETEHFGMTVVEAMASSLVPVVIAKGGLTEIVVNNQNGYTWQTIDELVAKTELLMASPSSLNDLAKKAEVSSKKFSKENFKEQLLILINKQ